MKIQIHIDGDNYSFDPLHFCVTYNGTGEPVHFAEGDFFQDLLF